MTLRHCVSSLLSLTWLVSCGGASAVESNRDTNRDDQLTADDADEAAGSEGASAETTTVATAPASTVGVPPPLAAPPLAVVPASPPTALAPATVPASLANAPVDARSWLNEEEPLAVVGDAGVQADAGFASELRVDDLTILVIFDNSGSMAAGWEDSTRWEHANRSLVQAIQPVQTSITVGAIRFPLVSECGVPDFDDELQFGFALGEDFLEEWVANALGPAGGTPLAQAFLVADEAIRGAEEMGLLDERFRVVLLTDGEPNCEGDPGLLTELPRQWHERGVETVVLGLPGSQEAAALLDDIAEAGGTMAHQSLGTVSELDHSTTAAAR